MVIDNWNPVYNGKKGEITGLPNPDAHKYEYKIKVHGTDEITMVPPEFISFFKPGIFAKMRSKLSRD